MAVSHGTSLAVVKFSVPVPVLLTAKLCGNGFDPSATALKLKAVVEIDRIGAGGALIASVTVTTPGEPVLPGDVIVT